MDVSFSRARLSVLLCAALALPLAAAHAQDSPLQRREADWQRRQVEQQHRVEQARERLLERLHAEQRGRAWEARRLIVYEQRRWSSGQSLPRQDWDSRYYVPDWRGRHLPPPMAGYQWLFVDDQYALMQLGTGLINRIVLP